MKKAIIISLIAIVLGAAGYFGFTYLQNAAPAADDLEVSAVSEEFEAALRECVGGRISDERLVEIRNISIDELTDAEYEIVFVECAQ
ncbi:MAG: hypothetical protein R3B52_02125 [Candidatus Paceibacterota bacterium]